MVIAQFVGAQIYADWKSELWFVLWLREFKSKVYV